MDHPSHPSIAAGGPWGRTGRSGHLLVAPGQEQSHGAVRHLAMGVDVAISW